MIDSGKETEDVTLAAATLAGIAIAFVLSMLVGLGYAYSNPNLILELKQLSDRLDQVAEAITDSHDGEPCGAEDRCPACREKWAEYERLQAEYRRAMLWLSPLLPLGAVLYWGPRWGRWLIYGSEPADPADRPEPVLARLIPFKRRHRQWMRSAAELGVVTLSCPRDTWKFVADWTAARHGSSATHWWWLDGQPPPIVEEPDGQTVTVRLPGAYLAELLAAMHWAARFRGTRHTMRASRDTRAEAAYAYRELTAAIERCGNNPDGEQDPTNTGIS